MTSNVSADPAPGPTELATHRSPGLWRRLITVAVVGAIALFLGRSIASQWDAIAHFHWAIRWGWLTLSGALVWVDFVILIALWRILLVRIGNSPLRFGTAYRVWFVSNFGKYLPGKVWTVMGMVYLLKREGYDAPSVLVSAVLNQALSVLSGLLLSIIVLGGGVFGGLPVWALALGGALSLAVLIPAVFQRLVNVGLRLIRHDPIVIPLSYGLMLALFLTYVGTWVIYGAAFWALLLGVGIESAGPFWVTVAIFCASYLLGFLAILVPGGLGVREGSLTVLLGSYLPVGLAAPIAVLSRIWLTLTEILGALPLLWLREKTDTT